MVDTVTDVSPQRRLSMRDVARLAGVSVTTVGNVLDRPHIVAAATRERVEHALAQANFVRSGVARQLKGRPSPVVGVVILDMRNPFYADLIRAVEDRMLHVGCTLMVCSTDADVDRESRVLAVLEEQTVRGIIVTPAHHSLAQLEAIAARGTPVVLMDYANRDLDLCSVSVDHHLGGRLAAEHLLELGHRRFAFVHTAVPMQSVMQRHQGFRDALRAGGLDPARALLDVCVDTLPTMALAEDVVDSVLAGADRPTAIVCMNDIVAMGVLGGLARRGIRVPEDISVVGYDDIPYVNQLSPRLTTIRQPNAEVGHQAAELLLGEDDPDHSHRQIQFRPRLIVRGSSAAPPGSVN